MCKHKQTTVVTGGKLAIHQCDICGATLWDKDVSPEVMPLPLDIEALKMWEARTDDTVVREWAYLEALRMTNPKAYREHARNRIKAALEKIAEIEADPDRIVVRMYLAELEASDEIPY